MKTFEVEIMTPEREFMQGQVEALTVTLPDGKLTVLAGHAPMIAVLDIGSIDIKLDGRWREAFNSEGFMEVRPDKVVVFTQACEWPEEINEHRAEEALERARERMRQKQSLIEYKSTQIALSRAMMRLSVRQSRGLDKQ